MVTTKGKLADTVLLNKIRGSFAGKPKTDLELDKMVREFRGLDSKAVLRSKDLQMFHNMRHERIGLIKSVSKALGHEMTELEVVKRVEQFIGLDEKREVQNDDIHKFLKIQKLVNKTTALFHGYSKKIIIGIAYSGARVIVTDSSWEKFTTGFSILIRAIALFFVSPAMVSLIYHAAKNQDLLEDFVQDLASVDLTNPEKSLDKIFEIADKILDQDGFFQYLGKKDNILSIFKVAEPFMNHSIEKEIESIDHQLKTGKDKNGKSLNIEQRKQLEAAKISAQVYKKIMGNVINQFKDLINDQGIGAISDGTIIQFLRTVTQETLKDEGKTFATRLSNAITKAALDHKNKSLINSNTLKNLLSNFMIQNYQSLETLGAKLPAFDSNQERDEFIYASIEAAIDTAFQITDTVGNSPDIINKVSKVVVNADSLKKEIVDLQNDIVGNTGTDEKKDFDLKKQIKLGVRTKDAIELVISVLNDKSKWASVLSQDHLQKFGNMANMLVIEPMIAGLESQIEALKNENLYYIALNKENEVEAGAIKLEQSKAQLQGLKFAQNIIQNHIHEVYAVFGEDVGVFLQNTLKRLIEEPQKQPRKKESSVKTKELRSKKAKAGKSDQAQTSSSVDNSIQGIVIDIIKSALNSNLGNQNELKTLVTSILQDNYTLLGEMLPNVPDIKDATKRNRVIKDAVDFSVDTIFDLISIAGNNPEIVDKAFDMVFHMKHLLEEGKALKSEIKDSVVITLGENLKEAASLLDRVLGNPQAWSRIVSENRIEKLANVANKLGITPQIEFIMLQLQNGNLTPERTKSLEMQLQGLRFAQSVLEKHSKEFVKILGSDMLPFIRSAVQGTLQIPSSIKDPKSKESKKQKKVVQGELALDSFVSELITRASKSQLISKQDLKILITEILQENYTLLQEMLPDLVEIPNLEERNALIADSIDASIEIVSELGSFLGDNQEFVRNAIRIGSKLASNTKGIQDEVKALQSNIKGAKRADTQVALGENFTEILGLINLALSKQEHLGKAVSADNLDRLCKAASKFAISPMIENLEAENRTLEKDQIKQGAESDEISKKIQQNKMQLWGLKFAQNIVQHHARDVHDVFGKDMGYFLQTIAQSVTPKTQVNETGQIITINPTLMDIISNIMIQSGKLELAKKDKLKTLLKKVIEESRDLLKEQLGTNISNGILFDNITDHDTRQKKMNKMIDAAVDSFYELTSAIGKNSEVSTQIVSAIFNFIQPTSIEEQKEVETLEKSKQDVNKKLTDIEKTLESLEEVKPVTPKEKSDFQMLKQEFEDKKKKLESFQKELTIKERKLVKAKIDNLVSLIGMVDNSDRDRVTKSLLQLAASIQIPGLENLLSRLHLQSDIYTKHLADAFKDKEFFKYFSEHLVEIVYPESGQIEIENILDLAVYVEQFYKTHDSGLSRKDYEEKIVPELIEVVLGVTRELEVLDTICGYSNDIVALLSDVLKKPEAVVQGLRAASKGQQGKYFQAFLNAPMSSAFSILTKQVIKRDMNTAANFLEYQMNNSSPTTPTLKLSKALEYMSDLYMEDAAEKLYIKVGYIPRATFKKPLDFANIYLDADLDFHKCDFKNTVKLNSETCNLQKMHFHSCNFAKLELEVENANDLTNVIKTIGLDTFTQLVNDGKMTLSINMKESDSISAIRNTLRQQIKIKHSKDTESIKSSKFYIDNFNALLLRGDIDFKDSLSVLQKKEIQEQFVLTQKFQPKVINTTSKLKCHLTESQGLSDKEKYLVQKSAITNLVSQEVPNHKSFTRYTQYCTPIFAAKVMRNILEPKSKKRYVSLKLYTEIANAYIQAKRPILLQGPSGKMVGDPRIESLVRRMRTMYPHELVKRYSDRLSQIIETHGVGVIDELSGIATMLESKFGGRAKDIDNAMQIVIDEMVVQMLDSGQTLEDCLGPIKEDIKRSDFEFSKLVENSIHHKLLAYGIEDPKMRAKAYDMIYQIPDKDEKIKVLDSLFEALKLDFKDLPVELISKIRDGIITCVYDRFVQNKEDTLAYLKDGKIASKINAWISEQMGELENWRGKVLKSDALERFENLNVTKSLFDIFQSIVTIDQKIYKEPIAPVRTVESSVSLYNMFSGVYQVSETALDLVSNITSQIIPDVTEGISF